MMICATAMPMIYAASLAPCFFGSRKEYAVRVISKHKHDDRGPSAGQGRTVEALRVVGDIRHSHVSYKKQYRDGKS